MSKLQNRRPTHPEAAAELPARSLLRVWRSVQGQGGMKTFPRTSYRRIRELMACDLLAAPEVDVGEWQSMKIDNPAMVTKELQNVVFEIEIPPNPLVLQQTVQPNLPWAEDHFRERVSGKPLNPPPSAASWPYTRSGHEDVTNSSGQFSHTYPERFWPKEANRNVCGNPSCFMEDHQPLAGIRFAYGDLNDVIKQLAVSPQTRQAYLPVWFPEDTGAVHKERVPCTLGYHFLVRRNKLNTTYFIRSCDFVRHFDDDVYMAGRLLQWVVQQLMRLRVEVEVGNLTMHICSLHIFKGDVPKLKKEFG